MNRAVYSAGADQVLAKPAPMLVVTVSLALPVGCNHLECITI